MAKAAILFALLAFCLNASGTPEDQIRGVLNQQVSAWNRGDLPAFVDGYLDSPDTVFIGADFSRGRGHLLERYQKKYPTPEKMGKLEFTDLEIQMLGEGYANVRGRFHLTRATESGGDARGVFTLLFRKTPQGWKIIQDHTS
jgi:uncharacterized protein (TIGR02246 family)